MSRQAAGYLTIALTLFVAGAGTGAAQNSRVPAVTILAFDPDSRSTIEHGEGDKIADDLAARLVDSGRYRVLVRAWLPVATDAGKRPSMDDLCAAAAHANLDYIVTGSVHRTTRTGAQRPSLLALGLLFAGRGRFPATRPPQVVRQITETSLFARVIDVTTGQSIRSMNTSRTTSVPRAIDDLAGSLTQLAPRLTHVSQ